MKQGFIATTVLAGLMGLGGASIAQTTAVPAAPDPAKGGEASTKKPTGNTANPTQRPDGSNPTSRADVKSEARAENRSPANSMVPKGEASTTMNNQPNMTPKPTGEMSRREVSQEARKTKPQMGQTGERPEVPTNPTNKTGTPK
ncbi:MAG: serine/threonine protein kinase [Variovorax sp.]